MNSPQTKRLNHWTFQNRDQILPVHAVTFKSVLIPILKEHKSITISEDLFMDIIGMIHYCPVKILDLEINRVDHHPLGR